MICNHLSNFGALALAAALTAAPAAAKGPAFTDVTAKSGVHFHHTFGDHQLSNILEATGPGCALLDFDGDGFLDLYIVNGAHIEGISAALAEGAAPTAAAATNKLYRNNGNGTFSDVTEAAGVGDPAYGIGAVAADYDNDGDPDLFVANYGPNRLYRNNGDGTFTDAAAAAGVQGPPTSKDFPTWSLHAAFVDYDRDGSLDLYVANYLAFDPKYTLFFKPEGFPGPLSYEGQADLLYHNNGDGTFSDVTAASGVGDPTGRAMSVGIGDYDDDGDDDIFVSNDAMPNFLYRNDGGGKFTNVALEAGVAFGEFGESTSSMAPAFADLDNDGDLDLFVPDMGFSCLYRNDDVAFSGITAKAGIAALSGQYTSWAPVMADFDNDGLVDIFVTNGDAHHLYPEEDLLLVNRGNLVFEDVSLSAGPYFAKDEYVGRGAVGGDLDNDGDIDLVVVNVGGPAIVLRNDTVTANHWLTLRLVGTTGNRDGIGARVRVRTGDVTRSAEAGAGGGYLSSNDPRVHFGLGSNTFADAVEITWPSGRTQKLTKVAADQILTVAEPEQ